MDECIIQYLFFPPLNADYQAWIEYKLTPKKKKTIYFVFMLYI